MNAMLEELRRQCDRGAFPGGQLCVIRDGNVIVDAAVGIASGLREGEPRIDVTTATRFGVFSCSKPFVAIAVALSGVDVHAPLSRYVPEWKHDRTVLDVLTHRSGILLPEIVADPSRWGDSEGIVRAIAATRPRYRRGVIAYAPYEFGWILAEIIRRVAEPLPTFLKRELLDRIGVDVAFTTNETGVARSYWLGGKRVVAGVELSEHWERVQNDPATRLALCPGAGLVTTAASLARFYAWLLADGRELSREYTTINAHGFDRSNRLPLRLGRGFVLGSLAPSLYGWFGTRRCFGHAGAFCSLAGADPDRRLALAYVTNGNRDPYDLLRRTAPLWRT